MPSKIPVYPGLLKWREPIVIEGLSYVLYFSYSAHSGRWWMDIHDADDLPLQSGVMVTSGWPLIQGVDQRLPNGQILCVRLDDLQDDPGLDDFGQEAILLYFPADEIPDPIEAFDYLTYEIF